MNLAADAESRGRRVERAGSGRAPTRPALEGVVLPLLGAAMAGALALIIWLGRGTTFSVDELAWFANTPGLDLGDAFAPHGGHLILTSRLVYLARTRDARLRLRRPSGS